MLIIGRLLAGYVYGVQCVVTPRYIEEYVPGYLYATCLGSYVFSMALGTMIALCSAFFLPSDTETQELIDSQVWRYILAFPMVLYLGIALILLTYIRHDSPKFYLTNNDRKSSIKVIH